jgi:DNA-binding response OmpR family regulator
MPPTVLIVDASADEREVLRTALARRGLRIFEAAEAETGKALARQHQPAVIVLDLDAQHAEETDWTAESSPSLIVLGTARRESDLPPHQSIAKPYHYAPLIARIEELAKAA